MKIKKSKYQVFKENKELKGFIDKLRNLVFSTLDDNHPITQEFFEIKYD